MYMSLQTACNFRLKLEFAIVATNGAFGIIHKSQLVRIKRGAGKRTGKLMCCFFFYLALFSVECWFCYLLLHFHGHMMLDFSVLISAPDISSCWLWASLNWF